MQIAFNSAFCAGVRTASFVARNAGVQVAPLVAVSANVFVTGVAFGAGVFATGVAVTAQQTIARGIVYGYW